MDTNKPKSFSDNVSVLDQFNATGVPTGTPESSHHQQQHPVYAKSHPMLNSAIDHPHRYLSMPHPPSTSTSSSYDFHNFDHKIQNIAEPVTGWSCSICHKPYKTIAGLDRHVRAQHPGINANTFEPGKCAESASDRNKSCICTVCGNGFPYQSKLTQHMRVHTGEKPFRCEYENCGKGFCRKDKLTRHMYIHTGERPFACSRCDKKFYRKDKLTRHERIHSDNKPSKQKPAEVKTEVTTATVTAPPPTMVTPQYNDIQHHDRNSMVKAMRSVAPQMPPHDVIVCRFCGAQFTDRPTFDHHLLIHATFLGTKVPEPVKFYGSLPNT